jgi:hypothetical protein
LIQFLELLDHLLWLLCRCGVARPADYFDLRLTAASSRVSGAIKSQRAKRR